MAAHAQQDAQQCLCQAVTGSSLQREESIVLVLDGSFPPKLGFRQILTGEHLPHRS